MKKITLFILILSFLIFSCHIEKRKFTRGYYVSVIFGGIVQSDKNDHSYKVIQSSYDKDLLCEKTDSIVQLSEDNPENFKLSNEDSILIISDKVGAEIDRSEKKLYKLFPSISDDVYVTGKFTLDEKGNIFLKAELKDGTVRLLPYSESSYKNLAKNYFGENLNKINSSESKQKGKKELSGKEKIERNRRNKKILVITLTITSIYGFLILVPLLIVNAKNYKKLLNEDLTRDEYDKMIKDRKEHLISRCKKMVWMLLFLLPSSVFVSFLLNALVAAIFSTGIVLANLIIVSLGIYASCLLTGLFYLIINFLVIKKLNILVEEEKVPEEMEKIKKIIYLYLFLFLMCAGLIILLV